MTLAKQGKDTSAMLMVAPANANNDTSAVHARTSSAAPPRRQLCDDNVLLHHNWADTSTTRRMMPAQG
jgi:hypothetical protein